MTSAKHGAGRNRCRTPASMRAPTARRRILGSLLASLAALISVSCGGGSSSPGTGASGTGGTSAGTTISLTIGTVTSPASIAGIAPQKGQYFITIPVTLNNVSAAAPVPVGFSFYSLATVEGLVIMPSADSAVVAMPCATGTSVTAGADYSCTVAFEVPSGDSPKQLTYDDMHGDQATAPVSFTMMPPPASPGCDTWVTYKNTQFTPCMTCTNTQCNAEKNTFGMCANGGMDSCLQKCPAALSDPNYCACHGDCYGACQPSWDALLKCFEASCAASCK